MLQISSDVGRIVQLPGDFRKFRALLCAKPKRQRIKVRNFARGERQKEATAATGPGIHHPVSLFSATNQAQRHRAVPTTVPPMEMSGSSVARAAINCFQLSSASSRASWRSLPQAFFGFHFQRARVGPATIVPRLTTALFQLAFVCEIRCCYTLTP